MIPLEWIITTRGIEGAAPKPRPGKPAPTCGAEGTGAGTPAKPWDRRRNGASRHRVCQACFIAGSLLLCTAGWLRSAAANPPPDANSVGSRGTTTILASLVAEARRSVFLSPGLRSCLPFALSINGKSKRANSAPPARASRPLDAAAEHAENLFRRALVLGRAAKSGSVLERNAASRATAEAAWFFCVYRGNGNLRNPRRFVRRVNRALRLDPRNPEALFMKAMWIWWGRKALRPGLNDGLVRIPPQSRRAAMTDLRLAVKVKPKFPEAWFALFLIGMERGATAAQLVNTVRYAKSADPFLDGGLPQNRRLMVSDARAFLIAVYPATYRKDFGHQPAPSHMTLW